MELSEFNSDYLANLLEKLPVENKTLVLLGDFNVDLLKYHTNSDISNFHDSVYLSLLLPHIASPAGTTVTSATLIDNIFSNNCNSPYTVRSSCSIFNIRNSYTKTNSYRRTAIPRLSRDRKKERYNI